MTNQAIRRPYNGPNTPWIGAQTWTDLLMQHWAMPPEALRVLVPAPLEIDTFEGKAWLGVVSFQVSATRLRMLPPLPGVSSFTQVNVRTYVHYKGVPGVYFLSLDVSSRLATVGARSFFGLPFYTAKSSQWRDGDWICFENYRDGAALVMRYKPVGDIHLAPPNSPEQFVAERYTLFVVKKNGEVYRGDLAHPAWELRGAEVLIEKNTMPDPLGLELPPGSPMLSYSRQREAVIWPLLHVS